MYRTLNPHKLCIVRQKLCIVSIVQVPLTCSFMHKGFAKLNPRDKLLHIQISEVSMLMLCGLWFWEKVERDSAPGYWNSDLLFPWTGKNSDRAARKRWLPRAWAYIAKLWGSRAEAKNAKTWAREQEKLLGVMPPWTMDWNWEKSHSLLHPRGDITQMFPRGRRMAWRDTPDSINIPSWSHWAELMAL